MLRSLSPCLAALALASTAQAAFFQVTKPEDTADGSCDADCSLREAVIAANETPGEDGIGVPAGIYVLSLPGEGPGGGDLDITEQVYIFGQGATIHGGHMDRIFDIQAGTTDVLIAGFTLRGGRRTTGGGGAIEVEEGAGLTLQQCVVDGNRIDGGGDDGGGIFNAGTLMVLGSTISGNATSGAGNDAGGGIQNVGTLYLRDSIVSGNMASDGAGIWTDGATQIERSTISGNIAPLGAAVVAQTSPGLVRIRNTTVSGNTHYGIANIGALELVNVTVDSNEVALFTGGDTTTTLVNSVIVGPCSAGGPITSNGGNLESPGATCGLVHATDRTGVTADQLALGPLQDNGGQYSLPTRALGADSAAAGAAVAAACPLFDQRRTQRDPASCDSGAYEASPRCEPGTTTLCIDDQPGDRRFKITVSYDSVLAGGIQGDAPATALDPVGLPKGGMFAFIDPANPEILVKVLNACAINNHFWVFYAATTTVGFDLTVEDTLGAASKSYSNPDRTAAEPVTDTAALASCQQTTEGFSFSKIELFPAPPATVTRDMNISAETAYTAAEEVRIAVVPDPRNLAFFSVPAVRPAGAGIHSAFFGSRFQTHFDTVTLDMRDPDDFNRLLHQVVVPVSYDIE